MFFGKNVSFETRYPELEDCRRQMRVLRQEIANESLLPYLAIVDAEEKLHNIDRRIEQLIRNSNKLHEEKVLYYLSRNKIICTCRCTFAN